jgi:hypothetical protein
MNMEVLNVSDIKHMLDKVMSYTDEQAEDSGMEGDHEYSQMCFNRLEGYKKAREEMSLLPNRFITLHHLPEILKEFVPSLNINDFNSDLDTAVGRETFRVDELLKEIQTIKTNVSRMKEAKDVLGQVTESKDV